MARKKVTKNEVATVKTPTPQPQIMTKNAVEESMTKIEINFKKLTANAKIPTYAHPGDIGMDVTATLMEYDTKSDCYIYHTGLACETALGIGCLGLPRSSNCKTDAYLTNSVGLIDSATYRGEIQFRYKNRTSFETLQLIAYNELSLFKKIFYPKSKINKLCREKALTMALLRAPYAAGDRVGQFIFLRFPEGNTSEVEALSETTRGTGGFGSTGK